MRRYAAILVLAVPLLFGCAETRDLYPPNGLQDSEEPSASLTEDSPLATFTNAQIEMAVQELIAQDLCGEPAAAYCSDLPETDGQVDVTALDGGVYFNLPTLDLTNDNKALAAILCKDVAAGHFDANGLDLGYSTVTVGGSANAVLASCLVPHF